MHTLHHSHSLEMCHEKGHIQSTLTPCLMCVLLTLAGPAHLENWDVMSESMFGDAGAARNSRRRSTARAGSAKSPATTPGQSQGGAPLCGCSCNT